MLYYSLLKCDMVNYKLSQARFLCEHVEIISPKEDILKEKEIQSGISIQKIEP